MIMAMFWIMSLEVFKLLKFADILCWTTAQERRQLFQLGYDCFLCFLWPMWRQYI